MPTSKPNIFPDRLRRILRRFLIVSACLVLFCLVIALVAAAFLPTIVSTDRARQTIEAAIESGLGHPVHVENIDWSWREGITVEDIRVDQPPGFSGPALISLLRADLDLEFLPLLDRRLVFSFSINKPTIRLIRDKAGRINLLAAFAGEKSEKKTVRRSTEPETTGGPVSLPADLSAEIDLSDIAIHWTDRQSSQDIRIEKGAIRLDTVSLVNDATRLSVEADIAVNGEKLPPAAIQARIRKLFDDNRQLQIQHAQADLTAELPGTEMTLSGDMAKQTIDGDIAIDLAEVVRAATPLAPGLLKESTVRGKLQLSADGKRRDANRIGFSADLTGKDLAVSGRLIGRRDIGPGDIGVSADGTFDQQKMALTLDDGAISLLKNSGLACRGTIHDIQSATPVMDITVSPIKIDISEIAAFAKPFMPAGLALNKSEAGAARLSVDKIRLQGRLPAGQAAVAVDALAIDVPKVSFRPQTDAPTAISLSDAGISINSFQAELANLFPTAARIKGAARLGRLTTKTGGNRMAMDGFMLDAIDFSADRLETSTQSPAGIAGKCRMAFSAAVDNLAFNDRLKLGGIEQAIDARADVGTDGTGRAALEKLNFDIADIRIADPAAGNIRTSAGLNIGVDELVLHQAQPLALDVNQMAAQLDIEELLSMEITADAEATGKTHVSAAAAADLDLGRLAEKFDIVNKTGIDAGGLARLEVRIKGRRPDAEAIKGLKALDIAGNLDFLDHCRLDLSLSKGALAYHPGNNSRLRVGRISGSPVLSLDISGKPAAAEMASRLRFGEITDLLTISPEKAVSGTFAVDLFHTEGHRLEGRQVLTLSPGDIEQSIDAAFDGADPSLARQGLWEIFQQISGRADLGIRIGDAAGLKHLAVAGLAPLATAGALDAAFGLRLTPENLMTGRVQVKAQDLAAAMKDTFSVTGVNGALELAKTVTVEKAGPAEAGGASEPLLSHQLMQTGGAGTAFSRDSKLAGMTEPADSEKGISLAAARINAGGLPIAVGPSRLNLGVKGGLPFVDIDQLEILGGSLTADAAVTQQQEGYALETRLNFTGIDPGILFPEAAAGLEKGASAVSGAVYGNLFLSPNLQQVLENTEIRIDFRKIGRRALERMLYAIDPYESNEAIVAQRRLLKNGTPKWVRLTIGDGVVSLEGDLNIHGVTVALPRLNRLNVAQIPGIDDYESRLSMIQTIVKALDLATAKTVSVVPSKSKSKSKSESGFSALRFR